MNVDEKQLKMIQELSDAPGPSGFEEEVLTVARRYAAPLGRIEEDFLRNLYIYRKENTGEKPILMLDAHADEVGFMIHSIKPNGCLRFVTLGGWNKNSLVSQKVLVRNAKGEYIPGIIAGDGEEQDVYILGVSEPITEFDGQVVAAICRRNDCEDKLVVVPAGSVYHQGQIAEAVHFQEQYFDTRIISCFEKSGGVLPYRMVNGQQEFLLVFETYSKCWSLPKGHIEAGETDVQAALRELYEETGMTAILDVSKTAAIEYPISDFARKQVVFF